LACTDLEVGAVRVVRLLQERKGKLRLKDVKTPTSRRRIRLSASATAAIRSHRERMRREGQDVQAGPVLVDGSGGFLRGSNVKRRSFDPGITRPPRWLPSPYTPISSPRWGIKRLPCSNPPSPFRAFRRNRTRPRRRLANPARTARADSPTDVPRNPSGRLSATQETGRKVLPVRPLC
jgi:hypothetical protein